MFNVTHEPSEFRPEIDGLRAVAVTVVVLFHVGVPGFDAGFIGVDVFYVISGFLITRNLANEARKTGHISLREFWARRARRLLPAASLVLAFAALGGLIFLSPLEWGQLGRDVLSSVFYVSNVLFLLRANGYFDADLVSSPVLHTWSLSVEEQFYVFWPILFLIMAAWARRSRRAFPAVAVRVLVATGLLSFAIALGLTLKGTPWAFFAMPTRAWQFAAGGLLALRAPDGLSGRAGSLAGVAAVVGLLLSLVLIDHRTAYPGTAALLPTMAAVAALAAAPPSATSTLLSLPPLRALGRISYSVYLWHWPLIVFSDAATDNGLAGRVGAAVVAVVLGAVTQRLIEDPVRFHPAVRAPRRSGLLALGLMATITVLVGVVFGAERSSKDDPRIAALLAVTGDPAGKDSEGCSSVDVDHLRQRCRFGVADGPTVLLAGDSHAKHWQPALEQTAAALGWNVIYAGRGGCPSVPVHVTKKNSRERSAVCDGWQAALPRIIDELQPKLVIISNSSIYVGRILDDDDVLADDDAQRATWRRGVARLAADLRERGVPLALILDTPRMAKDPLNCLARGGSFDACASPAAAATTLVKAIHTEEEAAILAEKHGSIFDPLPLLCNAETCPLQLDGKLVYRDSSHLAPQFVATLHPQLTAFFQAADLHLPGTGAAPHVPDRAE